MVQTISEVAGEGFYFLTFLISENFEDNNFLALDNDVVILYIRHLIEEI